jgi:uncharacterized delta-60 repeat protein
MQSKFTHTLGLTALLACFYNFNSAAQDGSLDPTFGTGGKSWTVSSSYQTSIPARILVYPDGRILHLATATGSTVFIRYSPNGAQDISFGVGGVRSTSSTVGLQSIRDAALQPDGKFIVVGEYVVGGVTGFGIFWYNEDGSLDNSFDGDGKVYVRINNSTSIATSVTIAANGQIVASGQATENGDAVFGTVRLNANGSLDTGFDNDGIVITNYATGMESNPDVTVQTDGKVVVGGVVTNTVPALGIDQVHGSTIMKRDLGVIRYNPDGSLDAAFGTGGKTSINTYSSDEHMGGIAVRPDGKIVLGGSWEVNEDFENTGFIVYRFMPNGLPDPLFGGSGYVTFRDSSSIVRATDLRVQADGRVLIAGYGICAGLCTSNAFVYMQVHRVNETGVRDGLGNYKYVTASSPSNPHSIDYGGSIESQGNNLILGGLATFNGETKALLFRIINSSPLLPESPVAFYGDADNDGYGTGVMTGSGYTAPAGFATRSGDCNDANAAIYPGAPETANGVDDNCNGSIDESTAPYTVIPAKIEAENWSAMSGVQTEPTTDAGGGLNVGYIDINDWMDYNISVPMGGQYTLNLRVATPSISNPELQVKLGDQVLATVPVPNTGGFQSWTTVSVRVTLPSGNHTVRLVSTGGGYWNINWLQFQIPDAYVDIPAKIEAEAWSRMSGVQTELTSDAGGGLNVGYIDINDWMEYNIDAPSAGWYNVNFRVATPSISNPEFEVRFNNGSTVKIPVPNTGGFQNWTTVSIWLNLQAGNQTIRLTSTGGGYWNINWLEFSYRGATATEMVAKPGTLESSEPVSSNSVNIYPNPVRDGFNLELDNKHGGAVRVEVVSITGRFEKGYTLSKTSGKSRHNLSLAGLAKGEYILKITMNGFTQTRKLIKL